MGIWSLTSNKIVYYSASGQKLHEEELAGEGTFSSVQFKSDVTAYLNVKEGEGYNSAYDIVTLENKKYMEFYSFAIFNSQYFEIQSKNATNMVWKMKFSQVEYDDESGGTSIADYAILTLNLMKN